MAMGFEHTSDSQLERFYRVEDEIASAITHGFGLVLSIVGLCVLISIAAMGGTRWNLIGCSIYGASLIALYGASTVYHYARNPRLKAVLRVVDHACIFLLIAGTYTPFTLTMLRGAWGWGLLVAIWTCALFGIGYKLLLLKRGLSDSAIPYILMSWLAIIAIKPIVQSVPPMGLLLLLLGGLFYMVGTVFYKRDHRPFYHAIWHIFVLAGSASHFLAIVLYAAV